MKLERSKVEYPLWRKKVDSTLFRNMTPIPGWACSMWDIQNSFCNIRSKKQMESKVIIIFEKTEYTGWITNTKRPGPDLYRLSFVDQLSWRLKEVFSMSFMRDLESRLQKSKLSEIEEDIPFWEFLDIEYDSTTRTFYFTAYYTQKPSFPELFRRLVGSPLLHQIDDELSNKEGLKIYKQDWKPREQLKTEINAKNVLYTLIDDINYLIYVGQAEDLIKRLSQLHPTIPNWTYYRYNILPLQFVKHRELLERMIIRDFAALFKNKKSIPVFEPSIYTLVNDKIDK